MKDIPVSSDPYVEEFSSKKFGTGTLEFMQLEKEMIVEAEGQKQDLFSDPMLVPKGLPKYQEPPSNNPKDATVRDSSQGAGGSYAQAFQKQKLDNIQLEIYKKQVHDDLQAAKKA